VDKRKRLEKKMRKANKTKQIDQNIIEEEMARIIPGTLIIVFIKQKIRKYFFNILTVREQNLL